jgi:hypothetical protein
MKPLRNKIILVCYIRENISHKRHFVGESYHVILLRIDSGYSVEKVAGLYTLYKIEENETALS